MEPEEDGVAGVGPARKGLKEGALEGERRFEEGVEADDE